MAETELGQLAADKASKCESEGVGQRMVTDHGKAGEMKTLAASKHISLPKHNNTKAKATKKSAFEAQARRSIAPTWQTW